MCWVILGPSPDGPDCVGAAAYQKRPEINIPRSCRPPRLLLLRRGPADYPRRTASKGGSSMTVDGPATAAAGGEVSLIRWPGETTGTGKGKLRCRNGADGRSAERGRA